MTAEEQRVCEALVVQLLARRTRRCGLPAVAIDEDGRSRCRKHHARYLRTHAPKPKPEE